MSSGPDSATSFRTNSLTILARIIAKDMLRKLVIDKSYPENVLKMPDKNANGKIRDMNNVSRSN